MTKGKEGNERATKRSQYSMCMCMCMCICVCKKWYFLQGAGRDPELAGDGLIAIDDLGAPREIPAVQHRILHLASVDPRTILSRPSTGRSIVDLDNKHLDPESIKRWLNMIVDLQVLKLRLCRDVPSQDRDRFDGSRTGPTITDEFDEEFRLVGNIVILDGLVLRPVDVFVGEEPESGSSVFQEFCGAGGDLPFEGVRRSAVHFLMDAEGVFEFDGLDDSGEFLPEIVVKVVVGYSVAGGIGVEGVEGVEVVIMMMTSVG